MVVFHQRSLGLPARQPLPSLSEVFCPSFPSSQERLLLSLLPAHIAMEMKAEIIQRLQGPKAGQMENTNNFHNLYVKRHTNVRYGAPCRPSVARGVGHHIHSNYLSYVRYDAPCRPSAAREVGHHITVTTCPRMVQWGPLLLPF